MITLDKWTSPLENDSGQVFVLFALMLVVLLGATGVAVDVATVYLQKTNLQSAVDAGALAGAQAMAEGNSSSTALSTARNVSLNNVHSAAYNPATSGNRVTVTGQEGVPTFFARILGVNSMQVSASGTAAFGPVQSATGVMPFGISSQTLATTQKDTVVSLTGSEVSAGNWGYLDLPRNGAPVCSTYPGEGGGDGNGASALDVNVACGTPGTYSIGEQVSTKPGVNTSHLANDIQSRIDSNSSAVCNDATTATEACPRVVTIPVVDGFGNGKSNVSIVGFAVFYLYPYDKGQGGIQGEFLQKVSIGVIAGSSDSNYGATAVSLIH